MELLLQWLLSYISVLGACLEDKVFPKTNSLHEGRAQPLADVNEFALKIKVSSMYSRADVTLKAPTPTNGVCYVIC